METSQYVANIAKEFGCSTKELNQAYENAKEIFEGIKNAFSRVSEGIKQNQGIQYAIKLCTDKELGKYEYMYSKVKSKRLKKKYKKKIDIRIKELM